MLLQFRVKNYKVFKEEQVFSMVASDAYDDHRATHTSVHPPYTTLNSAAIYGANAGGKTLLLEAMVFAKAFILDSFKESKAEDEIDTEPFLLHSETAEEPSEFEFIFLTEGKRYRYGFAVTASAVEEEWLYVKNKKEVEYFYRSEGSYDYNKKQLSIVKLLEGRGLVRDNALALSVMAQFNDEVALNIVHWFGSFNVISALEPDDFKYYTVKRAKQDPTFKRQVLQLLKAADVGIVDFDFPAFSFPDELSELKDSPIGTFLSSRAVRTYRYKYDQYNRPMKELVAFDLENDESAGTQKYFSLLGPIIDSLQQGKTLVVDELDARLHPLLVTQIVQLFHQKETNPKHAQFIFTTHDTKLIHHRFFRRDQIWFVDKDSYGASKIYSLSKFKTEDGAYVKTHDNHEAKYLDGQYRATPALWRFQVDKAHLVEHPVSTSNE